MNTSQLKCVFALIAALLMTLSGVAQQQPQTLDERDMLSANEALGRGEYDKAEQLYAGIQKNYRTSRFIPESFLKLAYVAYFKGDYDKGIDWLNKLAAHRQGNVTPEELAPVKERAGLLIAELYLAKGVRNNSATANAGAPDINRAISEFGKFIKDYPNSPEVETANFQLAQAHLQGDRYEAAVGPLRTNIQKFPNSLSRLDTQMLLARVLRAQAADDLERNGNLDTATPAITESEKMLREIAGANQDAALANEARFELGELLFLRSVWARDEDPAKQRQMQDKLLKDALTYYRSVADKEAVLKFQESRIAAYQELSQADLRRGNLQGARTNSRMVEKEREKFQVMKEKGDSAPIAKLKSGQAFASMEKWDEARVLLRYLQPSIEDPEQKKLVAYLIAVSYAAQHVPDKSEAAYKDFFEQFKNDKMGENLPLLLMEVFLHPKQNKPEKAISYADDAQKRYPNTKSAGTAQMRKAFALIALNRLDEAAKGLISYLATNPPKDTAAMAQMGLATIYQNKDDTQKAIDAYKVIIDKYGDTPEAEQAQYWVAQLTYTKGDAAAALPLLQAFVKKYPNHELKPNAIYFTAMCLDAAGKREEAVKEYEELAKQFPDSDATAPSFFRRAKIYQELQKISEAMDTMRAYIDKYPESEQIYSAYDYVAQMLLTEKKLDESIATYETFLAKSPNNPAGSKAYLRITNQHREIAEKMGRGYISLAPDKQPLWKDRITKAMVAAESLISKFPTSVEVAQALESLIKCQDHMVKAKLITEDGMEAYFQELGRKHAGQPSTKAKVAFAFAGYLIKKDKKQNGAAAMKIMSDSYDPSLILAAADLDLYVQGLVDSKKFEEALKVVTKLEKDNVPPANQPLNKAARSIQEAHANALYWRAQIGQIQGKNDEATRMFAQLKEQFPWSDKQLEADLSIAILNLRAKKFEEALKLASSVTRSNGGSPSIRARGMFLVGEICEATEQWSDAANNFLKIAPMFPTERELASEGLWKGAQILEKMGMKELPLPTPAPKSESKSKKK